MTSRSHKTSLSRIPPCSFHQTLNLFNASLFGSEIARKFLTVDNRMWIRFDSEWISYLLRTLSPFPHSQWQSSDPKKVHKKVFVTFSVKCFIGRLLSRKKVRALKQTRDYFAFFSRFKLYLDDLAEAVLRWGEFVC